MATEKTIIDIDVNAKGFISGVQEAKKTLRELGEIENISGMLEGFASMGVALGAVGATLYALKKGFDFTMEAEAINRVNAQFELLAENAGLAPEKLKKGLEESVAGLMDTDDALKVANKAIVELGVNASKIPEIMELARKVTTLFGGEISDNFEKISLAAASGNTRLLKQMGIIIDNDSALRTYAKTVGKFVTDLTEQEKKTALLNATLEKGKTAFKGATEDNGSLTVSWQKLKVAFKELFDFVIVKYDQMFGQNFRNMVKMAADAVKGLTTTLTANFGTGIEKTRAQAEKLKDQIRDQTEEVARAERMYVKYGNTVNGMYNDYKGQYEKAKTALANLQAESQKYDAYLDKHDAAVKEREDQANKPSGGGEDKRENEIKFNQDLLKLREARLMEQMDLETSYDKLEQERAEQIEIMHEDMENRIKAVEENARKLGIEGTEAAESQKQEIREKYALDIQKLGQDLVNDQVKTSSQLAKVSNTGTEGFKNGWKAAATSASKDVNNFAKLGEVAFNSLNKNGKSAFIALGDGSKTAGEAMKGFMLNSIADIAEAQGEVLLASGIGHFNPVEIAEGGALLTLSGILRSAAGGKGGGGIGASSGGGGGGSASMAESVAPDTLGSLQTTEAAKPQKAVTIQVQGNYFETEQTKRTLMEMIRQETDATSFSYVQINQGGAS